MTCPADAAEGIGRNRRASTGHVSVLETHFCLLTVDTLVVDTITIAFMLIGT